MKDYINRNVMPIVCKGLIDVCTNSGDQDPIDYLAEYLFKHYDEVEQPDAGVGGPR